MPVDYGADCAALPDLDPLFAVVTGRAVLIEALARRFQTPRGALLYAPDYGLDLRAWVNESFTPADLADLRTAIVAQCQADERVATADATVTPNYALLSLIIIIAVSDASGPFRLVLAVNAVSVAILEAQ